MVTDMKILYKDIKIGEKDKYSGAKSAWPAFYFSVKHSWDWFSHWWSFQQRPSQFSAALPITTNPSLFPGFSPYPGATKISPRGLQGGQRNQQELVCGWQCQGMVEEGKGRRRWWEGIPEACREGGLTSKSSETLCDSGPSWGEWVCKRAKGWREKEGGGKASMSAGSASGHSPGSQHRKSFILESACCRLLLSTLQQSQSVQLLNFWSCVKPAPTQSTKLVNGS